MASYLEVESDLSGGIFKNLVIPGSEIQNDEMSDSRVSTRTVCPNPGFCVKVRTQNADKVFVNICYSDDLPCPKDITEEELIAIIESEDPSNYKVPLSLGDPHYEKDKSDKICAVYDVVINTQFFKKIENDILFRTFAISVALEGLEAKHNITLEKQDFVVLKNKKYLGKIQTVTIKARPLIWEYDNSRKSQILKSSKFLKPKYEMRWIKKKGSLTVKVELPKIKSASEIILDMNEDHLVLQTDKASVQYLLDIYLPLQINPNQTKSEFNKKLQVLIITASVVPNNKLEVNQ